RWSIAGKILAQVKFGRWRPDTAGLRDNMHIVAVIVRRSSSPWRVVRDRIGAEGSIAHAAGDVESCATRIPDNAVVGVGNGDRLLEDRSVIRDIEDEDVLTRHERVEHGERPLVNTIKTAGQNQQGVV